MAKHERIKKPTKLNHSWVRKARLECESMYVMSGRDLTLTTGILTGDLDVFILSITAAVSSSSYRQFVLCVETPALMDVCRQPGETLIAVADTEWTALCLLLHHGTYSTFKLTETIAHLGRLTR